MELYVNDVIKCINTLLGSVKLTRRITALCHVTPELVTAMGERFYGHTITDMIWFLEQQLHKELQVDKTLKVLGHLKNDEYKRGDMFTVLSALEIVYSSFRYGNLKPFPPMT